MKKIIAICCASLMLLTPLASEAQPGSNDGDQGRPPNQQGGGQGQGNSGRPQGGQQQGRPPQGGGAQPGRPPQHGQPPQNRPPPQDHRPGGPSMGGGPQNGMPRPHSDWHRGGVAPPMYRSDRYWVTDWHSRHLRPPPPDHRWLWVNGDYVLVAITTGVIVQIMSGQ
jgi:Ni/Co efflux regulator RcnB